MHYIFELRMYFQLCVLVLALLLGACCSTPSVDEYGREKERNWITDFLCHADEEYQADKRKQEAENERKRQWPIPPSGKL